MFESLVSFQVHNSTPGMHSTSGLANSRLNNCGVCTIPEMPFGNRDSLRDMKKRKTFRGVRPNKTEFLGMTLPINFL